MRITISPNIRYIGLVKDYSLPVGSQVYQKFFNIKTQPFVINIPSPQIGDLTTRRIRINLAIRQKLRQYIRKKFRETSMRDIGASGFEEFAGANSPPIKIYFGDDVGAQYGSLVFDVNDELAFMKDNIRANFVVERTNNRRNEGILWGNERVWFKAPPSITYNKTDVFFNHTDSDLTCAYDYLNHTFGKMKGRVKVSNSKEAIDEAIRLPKEFHKDVYNEWLNLYQDDIRMADLIPEKVHTLPEIIDVEDLQDEYFEVTENNYNSKYTDKEKEDTLSIIDLVKWSIVANVRLVVFDYDNTHYCSYNPNDFKAKHNEIKTDNRRTIGVKVSNNHAYFIEDADLKRGISVSETHHNLELQSYNPNQDKEEKDVKECEYIYTPLSKIDITREDIEEHGLSDNPTQEDWNELKQKILQSVGCDLVENQPPLTTQELHKKIEGEVITHYCVDKTNLNGLVNYLYKYESLIPTNMVGSAKAVQVATFGNLKIYCNSRKPKTNNLEQGKEYEELYEEYPELESDYGLIPTATRISQEVYNKLDKPNILSMLNTQTRKMFYDSECKPCNYGVMENKKNKNYYDYPCMSIDLKRAYTNVLLNNDLEYQVYDSVSQPTKYKGEFNPSYFYLCYNRVDGYPCKKGKGLLLYHGSLVRTIMDKLIIKYQMKPKEVLPADHFVEFVEKCKVLSDEVIKGISSKELVNNFIGSLKRKDGVKEFKHFITPSKVTAERELMRNKIPTRLNTKGLSYKWEGMLISYPKKQTFFQTAQPIRLAIIDKITETMILIHRHYKTCLYTYKFGLNWLNNIKQRKILQKIRNKKSVPSKIKNKWNLTPSLVSVKTDALYINTPRKCLYHDDTRRSPSGWEMITTREPDKNYIHNANFMDYICDTWNKNSPYRVEREGSYEWCGGLDNFVVDGKPQVPYRFIQNKWKTDVNIDEAWELKTHYDWKQRLLEEGGMIEGLGGRGKSELVNELKDTMNRNRIIYKWKKAILKVMGKPYYEVLQEWRDKNPCFYKVYCPTNKSANRVGGQTFHKGLGIPVIEEKDIEGGEDEEEVDEEVKDEATINYMDKIIETLEGCDYTSKNKHKRPCSDRILVDEISMANGEIISYLAYIKSRIPRIKFIISGDIPHQLPPVKEEYRDFENAYVLKELTSFNKVRLNYNFRVGTSSDDLWDKWSLEPEKFKQDKQIKLTERNLCYTNATRKKVIDIKQDRLKNPKVVVVENQKVKDDPMGHNNELKYVIGTPLIAYQNNKDLNVAKNEMWYVCGYTPLTLCEFELDKTIVIEEEDLVKNFLSGYCITIHKSQGETYKDKYTIWDWKKISESRGINRRLRYVAQSRSSDPEKNISYVY